MENINEYKPLRRSASQLSVAYGSLARIYKDVNAQDKARDDIAAILPWVIEDEDKDSFKKSNKISTGIGILLLIVSITIFSSNSAVYQWILKNGTGHDDRNEAKQVFNPCYVNCGSNVIALLTLPIIFRHDLTRNNLQALTKVQMLILFISTLLYTVAGPFLMLSALQSVSIPTAAILQRLETVEFLMFSWLFLEDAPVDLWGNPEERERVCVCVYVSVCA